MTYLFSAFLVVVFMGTAIGAACDETLIGFLVSVVVCAGIVILLGENL
jgi:hypothetical protein